jgi:hypothetical protein
MMSIIDKSVPFLYNKLHTRITVIVTWLNTIKSWQNLKFLLTLQNSLIWFMVFNATFNKWYISYIVVVSFIGEGSTQRKPQTYRKWLTNFIT